jgi:hypothetical protein
MAFVQQITIPSSLTVRSAFADKPDAGGLACRHPGLRGGWSFKQLKTQLQGGQNFASCVWAIGAWAAHLSSAWVHSGAHWLSVHAQLLGSWWFSYHLLGTMDLKVADMERALRFYCGVLGFEITRTGRRWRTCRRVATTSTSAEHVGEPGGSPPPQGTTDLNTPPSSTRLGMH